MNLFSRPAPVEASASLSIERPELFTPEHLKPYIDTATADVRATMRMTDRGWQESFLSQIRHHVETVLVATKHGGVWPGYVKQPRPSLRMVSRPATLRGGKESTFFQELQPTYESTPEDDAAFARWEYSEAHRADFESEVASILESIEQDPDRIWTAYLHMRALERALELKVKADNDARNARDYEARYKCPVCMETDPAKNGPIESRSLPQDSL